MNSSVARAINNRLVHLRGHCRSTSITLNDIVIHGDGAVLIDGFVRMVVSELVDKTERNKLRVSRSNSNVSLVPGR